MKYKSLPSEIEAEQFLPPHKIPKGVINVCEMSEGFYTGEVWTIQGEKVRVKSGEWIVKEPHGANRYYPIADEVFKTKYVAVEASQSTDAALEKVKKDLREIFNQGAVAMGDYGTMACDNFYNRQTNIVDAYAPELAGRKHSSTQGEQGGGFLKVLEENYEAMKQITPDIPELFPHKEILIETYEDLISIYKK